MSSRFGPGATRSATGVVEVAEEPSSPSSASAPSAEGWSSLPSWWSRRWEAVRCRRRSSRWRHFGRPVSRRLRRPQRALPRRARGATARPSLLGTRAFAGASRMRAREPRLGCAAGVRSRRSTPEAAPPPRRSGGTLAAWRSRLAAAGLHGVRRLRAGLCVRRQFRQRLDRGRWGELHRTAAAPAESNVGGQRRSAARARDDGLRADGTTAVLAKMRSPGDRRAAIAAWFAACRRGERCLDLLDPTVDCHERLAPLRDDFHTEPVKAEHLVDQTPEVADELLALPRQRTAFALQSRGGRAPGRSCAIIRGTAERPRICHAANLADRGQEFPLGPLYRSMTTTRSSVSSRTA